MLLWRSRGVFRAFCALLGVGLAGLFVAAVAGVVLREWGNDEGSSWAFRLGLLVLFGTGTAGFGMLLVIGSAMWVRRPTEVSTDTLLIVAGLTLGCFSGLGLILWLPSGSGPFSLPVPARVGFVSSLLLIASGMARPTVVGLREAIRDRAVLIALVVLVGVILWGFASRS
jgi:hypothetical protein